MSGAVGVAGWWERADSNAPPFCCDEALPLAVAGLGWTGSWVVLESEADGGSLDEPAVDMMDV